jgi:hypothetical protein
MFGVLIAILHFNHVAGRRGFACKSDVPFIAPLRVSSRAIRPRLLGAAKSSWLGGVSFPVHVLTCNYGVSQVDDGMTSST